MFHIFRSRVVVVVDFSRVALVLRDYLPVGFAIWTTLVSFTSDRSNLRMNIIYQVHDFPSSFFPASARHTHKFSCASIAPSHSMRQVPFHRSVSIIHEIISVFHRERSEIW